MKYSIINEMYNQITSSDQKDYLNKDLNFSSHKIEMIDGIEYLITPEGKRFAIWGLLDKI